MGFSAEELVEVTFAVGQMAGLNLLYVAPRPREALAIDDASHRYVHLISEGVAIETFLKGAGPFKDTVYADELKKAEL